LIISTFSQKYSFREMKDPRFSFFFFALFLISNSQFEKLKI
jgi:hypothetical protein